MKKYLFFLPLLLVSIQLLSQVQKINNTRSTSPKKQPVMVDNPPVLQTVKMEPSYDFSMVKICMDMPVLSGQLPPRINKPVRPVPKINSDGSLSAVAIQRQGLVSATEKMWNPGDVITVYMSTSNGSDRIREKVKQYAKEWEKYANIKFDFNSGFNEAKIKIGFFNTKQSWSWIGRDVLINPFRKYTMNFGWFDHNTTETEFSRTILHEFGHALGFHHEHQSPAASFQWDLPKTYKYFKDEMNWTPDEVNLNVINKYSQSNTNYSAYDPRSIMHYFFPQGLVLNGNNIGGEYMLSSTDITYAGYWYPFPPRGSNTQGNLRTNDDCDDIRFSVEYDVVAPDMVEFNLSLGETNSKRVTWWKQVGIPMNNNTERYLWVQDHSLIPAENRTTHQLQLPFNDIKTSAGISFWKAKMLGVHTLLPYKWNVLPAIKGGCRIRLTWNKDSCL